MDDDTLNRLSTLEQDCAQLKKDVAENTRITKEINSGTNELLDLFRAAKGGIRVFQWIGSFLKWSAGIAAAIIGAWLAVREALGK